MAKKQSLGSHRLFKGSNSARIKPASHPLPSHLLLRCNFSCFCSVLESRVRGETALDAHAGEHQPLSRCIRQVALIAIGRGLGNSCAYGNCIDIQFAVSGKHSSNRAETRGSKA